MSERWDLTFDQHTIFEISSLERVGEDYSKLEI